MPISKFQMECAEILSNWVGYKEIDQNFRPDWLISRDGNRLELDLFVQSKAIAFEIQGDQHYKFTPQFHKSYEDFEKYKDRDLQKKLICEQMEIRLFLIDSVSQMEWTVSDLKHQQSLTRKELIEMGFGPPRPNREIANYAKAENEVLTIKRRLETVGSELLNMKLPCNPITVANKERHFDKLYSRYEIALRKYNKIRKSLRILED